MTNYLLRHYLFVIIKSHILLKIYKTRIINIFFYKIVAEGVGNEN